MTSPPAMPVMLLLLVDCVAARNAPMLWTMPWAEAVAVSAPAWRSSSVASPLLVALITASPNYTAAELAGHLGMGDEDVMATRFEVVYGRFTGRLLEPMIYGQGKLDAARAYAAAHAVDLRRSYFYTDSIADLPLLEMVGFPVAVNPDRRLRHTALARGWSVVNFY